MLLMTVMPCTMLLSAFEAAIRWQGQIGGLHGTLVTALAVAVAAAHVAV